MKYLLFLLAFLSCDKIILGTKYNSDLDVCYGIASVELPLPSNICTNNCSLFRCPANYIENLCDTDPTMKKVESYDGKTRIAKYFIDGVAVSGTFADGTKVCNWGSLPRSCAGSFNLVKEERCY